MFRALLESPDGAKYMELLSLFALRVCRRIVAKFGPDRARALGVAPSEETILEIVTTACERILELPPEAVPTDLLSPATYGWSYSVVRNRVRSRLQSELRHHRHRSGWNLHQVRDAPAREQPEPMIEAAALARLPDPERRAWARAQAEDLGPPHAAGGEDPATTELRRRARWAVTHARLDRDHVLQRYGDQPACLAGLPRDLRAPCALLLHSLDWTWGDLATEFATTRSGLRGEVRRWLAKRGR